MDRPTRQEPEAARERERALTESDRRRGRPPEGELNPYDEEKVEIVRQFFKDALRAERGH